ncbi:hypothetical protein CC78DRAFT_579082 [Lojkania enalia]|uniref:Uncharacterized protein n=1 Tax=Lojkania enalia TaxID=147567 RepID=A0A9P4N4E2_9PLEO|nr:hypothetical protein CC78DRAFT_579082 [Didymosphaeria enalia]
MSAHQFEAALKEVDNVYSNSRLYQLTAHTKAATSSASLSLAAEKYVRAFSDNTTSVTRRRWVGLALRRMIHCAPSVLNSLKTKQSSLSRLGEVILGATEMEETKIVAGLIIREAMTCGIDFPIFWASEKIPNNAPFFPKTSGPKWMAEFQQYLDELVKLRVAAYHGNPVVLYAISLYASDDFKWRDSDTGVVTVLIQGRSFTLITPESPGRDPTWVDIPLQNIRDFRRKKSALHDSQSRDTEYEPWDLVLALESATSTYYVNTTEHTGETFTILFTNRQDTLDCESCLREVMALCTHESTTSKPKMCSTQVLDISRSDEDAERKSSPEKQLIDSHSSNPAIDKHRKIKVEPGVSAGQAMSRKAESIVDIVEISSHRDSDSDADYTPEPDANMDIAKSCKASSPVSSFPALESAVNEADQQKGNQHDHSGLDDSTRNQQSRYTQRNSAPGTLSPTQKAAQISKPSGVQVDSARRALPSIRKPNRTSNANGSDKIIAPDEFEFPEESPQVKRPLAESKKQLPYTKLNSAAAAPRITHKSAATAKPIGPKPKPKLSQNLEVDNAEEDEDPISFWDPNLSVKLKNRSEIERTTESIASTVNRTERLEQSKVGSRPPGLPKVLKNAEQKFESEAAAVNGDVFTIPLDKEQKRKPRTKRVAAKTVNYNEDEGSQYGSSESEYMETTKKEKKSRVSSKQVKQQRVGRPNKIEKSSGAKSKLRSRKALESKALIRTISPVRHPVVSRLSRAQRSIQTISKTLDSDVGRASTQEAYDAERTLKATPSEKMSVMEHHALTNTVPSSQHGLNAAVEAGHHGFDLVHEDDLDVQLPQHPSSPPVPAILETKPTFRRQNRDQNAVAHCTPISQAIEIAPQKPKSLSQRKRAAESSSPSTPELKRVKRLLPTNHSQPHVIDTSSEASWLSTNHVRIMEEPSSPCDDARRARHTRHSTSHRVSGLTHNYLTPKLNQGDISHGTTTCLGNKDPQTQSPKELVRGQKTGPQLLNRSLSWGSSNAELLSSNSKPIPASPHADSTAISGHRDIIQVQLEKDIGEYETAKSDPFNRRRQIKAPATAFTRRLTEDSNFYDDLEIVANFLPAKASEKANEQGSIRVFRVEDRGCSASDATMVPAQTCHLETRGPVKAGKSNKPRQALYPEPLEPRQRSKLPMKTIFNQGESLFHAPQRPAEERIHRGFHNNLKNDIDMEGDETLVTNEEAPPKNPKPPPVNHPPSSPGSDPSSSHSSTSAKSESDIEPDSSIPTDEAEDMEWEQSLQPHQRAIHDQLIRVSKRVVRHVVDKETALKDIIDMYETDGLHMINELADRHSAESKATFRDIDKKKVKMKTEFDKLARRLSKQRKRFSSQAQSSEQGVKKSNEAITA